MTVGVVLCQQEMLPCEAIVSHILNSWRGWFLAVKENPHDLFQRHRNDLYVHALLHHRPIRVVYVLGISDVSVPRNHESIRWQDH